MPVDGRYSRHARDRAGLLIVGTAAGIKKQRFQAASPGSIATTRQGDSARCEVHLALVTQFPSHMTSTSVQRGRGVGR
jgi:hypothetical protein